MSYRMILGAALLTAVCVPVGSQAQAIAMSQGLSAIARTADDVGLIEQVARRGGRGAGMRGGGRIDGAGMHRGDANMVRRTGNGNVNRRTNINVNRPTTVGVGGGWRRPAGYWWRPGGAIAAGAAIGFVSATAASAYAASPAPGSNYCWYYTDQSRTSGFWDACP